MKYEIAPSRSFRDAWPAVLGRLGGPPQYPLDDYGIDYSSKDDLLGLYKKAATALKLNAESVPSNSKGSQAAQGTLRALATTVQRLAERRNELGLGHGRSRASDALTRHARLAFNTAAALAEFLLDTWHARRQDL